MCNQPVEAIIGELMLATSSDSHRPRKLQDAIRDKNAYFLIRFRFIGFITSLAVYRAFVSIQMYWTGG